MRRVCARALVIASGAVVGTAAAWLISSAGVASAAGTEQPPPTAETEQPAPTPITDLTLGTVDIATDTVSQMGGEVADVVEPGGAPPAEHGAPGNDASPSPAPEDPGTENPAPDDPALDDPAAEDGAVPAPEPQTPSRPVHEAVDSIAKTSQTVQQPVGQLVGIVEQMLYRPDRAPAIIEEGTKPRPAPVDYGDKLRDSMRKWFGDATDVVNPGQVGTLLPAPEDAGEAPFATPAMPSKMKLPHVKPQHNASKQCAAETGGLVGNAFETGLPGSDASGKPVQAPTGPVLPPGPFGPAPAPIALSSSGGGLAGQQQGEYKPGSMLPGSVHAADELVNRAKRSGSQHTPKIAGAQPGTTPD